jgi:hypothetical protein
MDILGAFAGVGLGQALAPFNIKAQVDYITQGSSGGLGRLGSTINAGVGATVGYASLGLAGIQTGAEQGVAGVIQASAKPYYQVEQSIRQGVQSTFDVAGVLTKYAPYIALGVGAILIYGMVKKK